MFGEMDEHLLRESGVTSEQLQRLSSLDLIELAITRIEIFKVVLKEFARRRLREPDAAAEDHLITAYRERRAPGWLTAALLPEVGSLRGYEISLELLLDDPGWDAAGYATQAMISIDRERACRDLLQVICNPEIHVRARRYAGDALKKIGEVRMVPTVLDAVRSRRLGIARASAVLRPLSIPTTQIVAWLEDGDDAVARVGFAIGRRRDTIEPELARAMHDALEANRIELSPSERESVEARIEHTIGRDGGAA